MRAPVHNTSTEDQRGYSFIELLVAMTVSVILIGGLYQVLFESQATFESAQDQSALRQQARVAVNQLADELRMAGYDLGSAPERLSYAGVREIQFVADIDDGSGDAPCDLADEIAAGGGAERMRYRVVGTDLLLTVDCWDGGSWGNEFTDLPIASDVQSARALFRYFDEDGNELLPGAGTLSAANRDLVRLVEIQLDLTDPDNQVI
ncbi:MAG: prepilin-type N-terminal cleavage/methylation domain-containing protein, partial [Acidobacteriota bacterium]